MRKRVNWVLDADIRDFFGTIDHGWMMRFIQHRIADRRIHRLIQKWLTAGVSEDGTWMATEKGTPQGAVASPLLANCTCITCSTSGFGDGGVGRPPAT
jgi:RNA-directed DNA polymerase